MSVFLQVTPAINAASETARHAIDQGDTGLVIVFAACVIAAVLAVFVYLGRRAIDKAPSADDMRDLAKAITDKQAGIETTLALTNEKADTLLAAETKAEADRQEMKVQLSTLVAVTERAAKAQEGLAKEMRTMTASMGLVLDRTPRNPGTPALGISRDPLTASVG